MFSVIAGSVDSESINKIPVYGRYFISVRSQGVSGLAAFCRFGHVQAFSDGLPAAVLA
jgi:hypothetical protein